MLKKTAPLFFLSIKLFLIMKN